MSRLRRTVGIVQARVGSTRMRAKSLRTFGGKPLVEWVVRRVTDSECLDGVIVATGDSRDDRRLAQLVPPDVPVFCGSESDVLGRFVAAAKKYRADAVVRVCADNPFVDPVLIDRLVRTSDEHGNFDYISYCSGDGRPVIQKSLGLFAEWSSTAALERAARATVDPVDREHVTRYIYSHPELFDVRLMPVPDPLDRDDLRLTIDIEEDWDHAQAIVDALGPDELDWQRIARLLDHNPGIRQRMADLNRTHAKV